MNRITIAPVIWLVLICSSCGVSDSTWENVRKDLASIKQRDRQYRDQMDSVGKREGWQSSSIKDLWDKQRVLDSSNLKEVDKILTRYGYPPATKVGDLSQVPFTVIQHADDSTRATYFEMILGAGLNGDLRMRDVAQYQDKILLIEKKPQEYGTQIWIDFKTDAHGARYDSVFLWPVRDRTHVNDKRLAIGLDSLETTLRRYGINPSVGYMIKKSAQPTSSSSPR